MDVGYVDITSTEQHHKHKKNHHHHKLHDKKSVQIENTQTATDDADKARDMHNAVTNEGRPLDE